MKFQLNSIRTKITILTTLLFLVTFGTIFCVNIYLLKNALISEGFQSLTAIQILKKEQLKDYFQKSVFETKLLANTSEIKESQLQHLKYLNELKLSKQSDFNINDIAIKKLSKTYSAIYKDSTEKLTKFKIQSEYENILFLSPEEGHILYSAEQTDLIGANLVFGKYKNSSLSKLFFKLKATEKTEITDTEIFPATTGKPTLFIGTPITENAKTIGYLVLQLSQEKLTSVLNGNATPSRFKSFYAVGEDQILRTEINNGTSENNLLQIKINAPSGLCAKNGVTKNELYHNLRDIKVLSSYSPLGLRETFGTAFEWGVIAEIDETEILKPLYQNIKIYLFVFLLLLLISVLLNKIITTPLTSTIYQFSALIQSFSKGDLALDIRKKLIFSKDEIGAMNQNLTLFIEKLKEVLNNLLSGTKQIATYSQDIAQKNQELSSRTEQQTGTLKETSSSMEAMSASIKMSAEHARVAALLSSETNEKSQSGSMAVEKVIGSMNEINSSSKKITEIIGVMNDIAFQTNILALNASIEAAKAGEQGRGFAVVAVEVRKLAQRSDQAAREISLLINESGSKIQTGVSVANEAGDALGEIKESVSKVMNLIADISAASNEQLLNIQEINSSLKTLETNNQQYTLFIEEIASVSNQLSIQANERNEAIVFFNTGESTPLPKTITLPPPSPHPQKKELTLPLPIKKNYQKSVDASIKSTAKSTALPKNDLPTKTTVLPKKNTAKPTTPPAPISRVEKTERFVKKPNPDLTPKWKPKVAELKIAVPKTIEPQTPAINKEPQQPVSPKKIGAIINKNDFNFDDQFEEF